ncbi:MAG TPA: nitroreductase family protein [Egibacteraceae bacterium]|nr:nitroreductase family protein [Egibacteraceae bacterium]
MDLAEVVRRRRMVRRYRPDPVEPAALTRILDTARRAPSAGFSQGQHFVVVTDPGDRARLAAVCGEPAYAAAGFEPWLSSAPVHVVPCVRRAEYLARYRAPDKASSTPPDEWRVPFWWVDAGAALMLLLLAAVDEGLGAGLLAVDDVAGVRALLALPADVEPLGVVTIGHPAPDRRSRSLDRGRRPLDEVVHDGRWRSGRDEDAGGRGC